jgi:ubiquitin carboxyl-terminal hydrolase 9/13
MFVVNSYCNSILQCLYYSKPFREHVVNFPSRGQPPYVPPRAPVDPSTGGPILTRINTEPLPTTSASAIAAAAKAKSPVVSPTKDDGKKKPLPATAMVQMPATVENKDSPDYKKKKALETGPVLDLDQGNHAAYGMEESLFTALKDIFESIMAHNSKTGIVKPNKFLEILRRGNDMFNGQQHQDAHEFLNYVLNQVIENVETHQKKMLKENGSCQKISGSSTPLEASSGASTSTLTSGNAAGWIHDLFEGLLSSETKCLTCENVSRRDEQFMDLSIDLEKNSSVTSCLRNFSASEMLCERNKFHCDHCGGLQEAEKRMKIKRLPRVLALHLKRFKYMESTSRFEKLHYRVLYPYHLRLFNTTDDAADPDRLYELYAVVVHIGGGPYHGHYVAIVKTEDKGWLLFDDELVEPVDKSYVRNFFGERTGNGVASAYVLFYQETTLEAVQKEMGAEEQAAAASDIETADLGPLKATTNGVNGHTAGPPDMSKDELAKIHPIASSPFPRPEHPHEHKPPANAAAEHPVRVPTTIKSKKEREREKKEEKEREKAERKATKSADEKETGTNTEGRTSMSRFRTTSRSLRQPNWLQVRGGSMKERRDSLASAQGDEPTPSTPLPQTPAFPTTPGFPKTPAFPITPGLPKTPGIPTTPHMNGGFGVDESLRHPPTPVAVENAPFSPTLNHKKEKREKERKDSAKEEKDKDKKKVHRHRPSLFGLRKRAKSQTALGAGE